MTTQEASARAAAEDERLQEVCGERSGRVTRLRRQHKKNMDMDEESYMEMHLSRSLRPGKK
jgi:hypothetical protein